MSRAEIIASIKHLVSKTAPDATVILYGSEARSEARPDSDIDLLILVDREKLTYEDKCAITYPLYDIEFREGVSIAPLVLTRHEWFNRPFKTPFFVNVMNEGILL